MKLIPDRNKAIFYAKRNIAQIVTDVVNLEDINYTVPEVQTLLDGITVGGHKIQDELITLNQINSWRFLFAKLDAKTYECTPAFLLELHARVAREEALTWGTLRNGRVTIAGSSYLPPAAEELPQLLNEIFASLDDIVDIYDRAIYLFAKLARTQFFYDGNKRTARMMMSGLLLDNGYPMISVSVKDKTEFNQVMIEYYATENLNKLGDFLKRCLDQTIMDEFTK